MHRLIALIGALVLFATIIPASATAAEADHYRFRGLTGMAYFITGDGCVKNSLFIYAGEGMIKDGGEAAERHRGTTIWAGKFDECTGEVLQYGYGWTPLSASDFHINPSLNQGMLNATVEIQDLWDPNHVYPLTLKLSWAGTGERSHDDTSWRIVDGTIVHNWQWKGDHRTADAFATIASDELDFDGVVSSHSASLYYLTTGYVHVEHP